MSVSTSLSLWCSSRASVGRNCRTTLNLGGGFLFLHRFDKVHVMFLRKPAYWYKTIYHMWKDDYQCRGIGLFNLSLELLLFGDARNIFTGCLALLPVINFFFLEQQVSNFCFLDIYCISLSLLHILFIYLKYLICQYYVQFLNFLLVCPSRSVSTGVPQFLILSQSHEDQDRHLQNTMVKVKKIYYWSKEIKERPMRTIRWKSLSYWTCECLQNALQSHDL